MDRVQWTDIPFPRKTKEKTFVTLNIDIQAWDKFNKFSELYGHGGKRRLMEFALNNLELLVDFPTEKTKLK
jgi:hypothetical protein